MSFFKEFKEDLSQAVNELVSDEDMKKDEVVSNEEYDEMVNTLDELSTKLGGATEMNNINESFDYLGAAAENSNEHAEEEAIEESAAEPSFTQPAQPKKPLDNEPAKAILEDQSISDEVAEVTKGTVIVGDITSEGSINLDGKVRGNVTCLGKLVISGEIVGASKAAEIYTNNSKISGDIATEGSIKVGNGSIIIGNVYAASAVIGGAIKGDIDVKGPVVLDSTAIVQGNIKSRAVQINSGAVVEGIVSQCYAEVDYNSLFDETFANK